MPPFTPFSIALRSRGPNSSILHLCSSWNLLWNTCWNCNTWEEKIEAFWQQLLRKRQTRLLDFPESNIGRLCLSAWAISLVENKSGAKCHALVILPIRCGLRHLRHFVSCVSACLIRQCQGALKQEGQPQKVTVPGCPVCLRHSALFLSFWFQLARQATHNLGINTAFPNPCDDNHYKPLKQL